MTGLNQSHPEWRKSLKLAFELAFLAGVAYLALFYSGHGG
jgi:hypothetical protein